MNQSAKNKYDLRENLKLKIMLRKLLRFFRRNYFISIFLAIILFVGFIAFYKLYFTTPAYVYAKVKMGQGLWWANTAKPAVWLTNAVKKGDKSYNLLGNLVAEIISVRRYPAWVNNQFDVYLTLRLKVNENKKTGEYTFNRSSLSVGSPIEIQFPKANITGTVIDVSRKPFADKYVEKTILLVNQGGYGKDFPYRYEAIQIGDKYFDGEENVFEVLDKSLEKNIWSVQNNLTAQIFEQQISTNQNVIVKAKIKMKEKNKELYFGEDYKINTNASIPFSTPNFFFEGFVIRKIE